MAICSMRPCPKGWPRSRGRRDQAKLKAAPAADQQTVAAVQAGAKKNALSTAALFPAIMLACYLALILHFKSRAGYRNEEFGNA